MKKLLLGLLGALGIFGIWQTTPVLALSQCDPQPTLRPDEPHPFRPNPGVNCTEEIPQTARLTCGTDLVAVKKMDLPRCGGAPGQTVTCTRDVTVSVPITIGLSDLELPIAGVASNTAISDSLSPASKMSQYTSWYLQGATDTSSPAGSVAAYMNSIIALTNDIPNVKLLSPAFNITSATTSQFFTDMEAAGANFAGLDGFSGNTYTTAGRNALDWYADFLKAKVAQYGKKIVFTEFGDFDTFTARIDARGVLIQTMKREFQRAAGDETVESALYSNAFGGNPEFAGHKLSDAELRTITSGNPRKAGVNSASGIDGGGGFASHASSVGVTWSLEIAYSLSDKDSIISAFNTALGAGMKPVLRICSGNSCAFNDPAMYANFLKDIAAGLTEGDKIFWAIAGPNEPEAETWASGSASSDEAEDNVLFSGPIKKLIPAETINQKKQDIINEALAGKTYNQIIGYVKDGKVISRLKAKSLYALNSTRTDIQKMRLKDMKDHNNPPYIAGNSEAVKWYQLWQQTPFVQTVDLPGEVFATLSQSDPDIKNPKLTITSSLSDLKVAFPHLMENNQLTQLLQAIIKPAEVPETTNFSEPNSVDYSTANRKMPFNTGYCNVQQSYWNPGDNLESTHTITGAFSFTKKVTYSYRELTLDERAQYLAEGVPLPTTEEVDVSGPVSIYARQPLESDDIYDRLVNGPGSIFKALFPIKEDIEDYPAAAAVSLGCGANCEVWPGNEEGRKGELFFAHWGSTLAYFHQKLQRALNPTFGTSSSIASGTASSSSYTTLDMNEALAAASLRNNVPLALLQVIYEIEGTEWTANKQCVTSVAGAVGPMQMTQWAFEVITTPEERSKMNRCNPGDAAELAARLLKYKVGQFTMGNPTAGKIDAKNKEMIKNAAYGYYGSCSPDPITQNRWGSGIGYCDFVIYRMELCQTLASTCDGE